MDKSKLEAVKHWWHFHWNKHWKLCIEGQKLKYCDFGFCKHLGIFFQEIQMSEYDKMGGKHIVFFQLFSIGNKSRKISNL